MRYNFDEIIERRHTNATNTDGFRQYIFKVGPEATFAYRDEEFVRMWIADMEFAVAPEICDAIRTWVDKRIFGYTMMYTDDYYKSFSKWCGDRYDWGFSKEELTFAPGVVPAITQLVELLVNPSEKVLTHTPAYSQFKRATDYNQCELVCSPLKCENGYYNIDFADFERKAADPKMKLVILCNPHNPTGRIWTVEELAQMAAIVRKYDLWLISDEIHCDLVRNGNHHTPMGKIMPDYPKLITCMSASKTFNIAGLMFSNIIIRDAGLRQRFCDRDKSINMLNPLSIAAHKAAYDSGADWLTALNTYLDDNFRLVESYISQYLPKAVFRIPESTYLAWVDLNSYLADVENLSLFFANEAGVLLEGGNSLFVGNATGTVRLNLAMPRATLEEGLRRICQVVNHHVTLQTSV